MNSDEWRPKVVLLGAGGVGKTALVLRFTENKFSSDYDPTLEDLYQDKVYIIDGEPIKLDLLDTAGQEEYQSLHDNWINEGDAFMIVYSVTEQISFEEAEIIYEKIMKIRYDDEFPIVLVGNKIDLTNLIKVNSNQAHQLAKSWNAPHFQTSAKEGIEVEDAFFELVRELRRIRGMQPKTPPPPKKESKPCCTIS